ncbi:MAG: phosphoglucosamine mutase [Opitutaceae bacterium]
MTRQYFGTDGVRGPCGGPVVNPDFARRLGAAAGRWLKASGKQKTVTGKPAVLLGRDTRFSGPALEQAVAAGLADEGFAPASLGVVPTPVVARAVRTQGAALGVVITASHNPATDNGIKFFNGAGTKLTDEEESQIEQQLETVAQPPVAASGQAALPVQEGAAQEYIQAAAGLLRASALENWNIVLDTANGAACVTSPGVLRRLGARITGLGDAPDGRNINDGVGSEHPAGLCAKVREAGARLGIAHDGDGDRCVLCDEKGEVLDGDEILTILAVHGLRSGTLAKNTLVVTEQSNLGVDAAIKAAGGHVLRTPVGDRYVSERMLARGAMLGGESSGHVICAEVSPAGDGLIAALKVIEVMLTTGRPLSELRQVLRKYAQLSAALPVKEKRPLETLSALQAARRAIGGELGEHGRVLVRYSGTEPKIRLLVEGENAAQVQACLDRLQAAVRADLAVP